MMRPGLYTGMVMHQRLRPTRHRFAYRCLWLLIDLDHPPAATRLFSPGRFNLFSFFEQDHADGGQQPLRAKIGELAARHGIPAAGRILLLTCPRILGHAFNPLSVYFCHDAEDRLCGIVWEVSSTFGERHSYVLPVDTSHGGAIRQRCAKAMHVSPFLGMALEYRFRVKPAEEAITICIVDRDDDGPVLTAALALRWSRFTDGALLSAFCGMAAFPFKTLLAIHWQALRLALRGLPLFSHPGGKSRAVSTHSASSA